MEGQEDEIGFAQHAVRSAVAAENHYYLSSTRE